MRTLIVLTALWIATSLFIVLASSADAPDAKQVRLFRAANPCPATGNTAGACPGWVVDHVKPLCAGGADHPGNMQWQTKANSLAKDKEERRQCAVQRHG